MNPFGISIIASYVPRQCGIGTFTHDLSNSILSLNASNEYFVNITALNNISEGYKYQSEVKFEIKDRNINDFKEAAYFINLSNTEVVNIQHEFGLYGGEAGANILYLLEKLTKPVVTTLHTILEHPTPEQLRVLQEIGEVSSYLVVLSKRAFKFLEKIYKIPSDKIKYIPHGAHDVPFLDPAYYKDKFRLTDRKVLMTFGLLGPGKGLEDVINSMNYIVEENPEAMYIVLGATHPTVKKSMGESYRNSLENLVKKNGLENNVMFINRFVDTKELLEFLLMSDVYVSPYHNKEQIVSGTLTYALGCGKAIVSTPYWYAEELLADERGSLVPFKDPKGMGLSIKDLIQDEGKRNKMRKKAYDYGRQFTWQNVAKSYVDVFYKAVKEYKRSALLPLPASRFNTFPSLPDVNLNHFKNLTDDTGIMQHAKYSIPNPHEGYCTDDNVRALLIAIIHKLYFNDDTIEHYVTRYLQFVYYAFNEEKGLFRNFMSYDRKWLDEAGSEDCNGRVIFTLGYALKNLDNHSSIGLIKKLFDESIKNMESFKSPRAIAQVIIGCIFYLYKFSGARDIKKVAKTLADRLFNHYTYNKKDDWHWYENYLTYENARIPQAILMAGIFFRNNSYIETGLESNRWYMKQIFNKELNCVSLVGNQGWYQKNKSKAQYDQQPVEIPAIIDACYQSYLITHDKQWLNYLITAFNWFMGVNDKQEVLVDFTTGGCRDGLNSLSMNYNQGAESTLSWLMSLHRMIRINQELYMEQNYDVNEKVVKNNNNKKTVELVK